MSASITSQPPIPSSAGSLTFWGSGLSHAGCVRERNEDAILTDPGGVLWAVADGMGGYERGDLASDILIDCLAGLADNALAAPALRMQIEDANKAIIAAAAASGRDQMGATVVAAMIQNTIATIAWVGDCRAYLWRHGSLQLLTRDHSVVQEMVDQGLLRDEERESHPDRHVVTRAVGIDAQVKVDTVSVPMIAGDRMLLCSDGLTACLGDQELSEIMTSGSDPDDLCRALVMRALELGAPDNVSVVGVFATEGGG